MKLLEQVQIVTKWLNWIGMPLVFGSETYFKHHYAIILFVLFLIPPVPFPGTPRLVGEGKKQIQDLIIVKECCLAQVLTSWCCWTSHI